MRLLIPMLLVACGDKDTGEPVDTGEPAPLGQDGDGDGYLLADDCDDTNPAINPGAEEVCDGKDNDCDAEIDEDVKGTFYQDNDGDGYGNDAEIARGCTAPAGYVEVAGDCNDSTKDGVDYSPDIPEVCDGEDNDCDEEIDEGVTATFYPDSDGDGYGVEGKNTEGCEAPSGYSAESTDCDDADGSIFPGAPEVCGDDEVNDCDGSETDAAAYCDRLSGALDLDTRSTQSWIGRHNDDYAAFSVALLGDMTGDGRSEILIGAPYEDVQAEDAGGFYVVDGTSTDADLDNAMAIILGDGAGDSVGYSVAALGDINNDGYADFAVGSPLATVSEKQDGAAYVYYGPVTGSALVSDTVDYTLAGEHSGSATAFSMASAGDVNGDGYLDVLVNAYYQYDRHTYPGAAHLMWGPIDADTTLGAFADVEMMGITDQSWTAYAASGIGDINGDGYDEVAVGSPIDSVVYKYDGVAYIVYGGTDLVSDDLDDYDNIEMSGAEEYGYFGLGITGGMDVNSDGYDDYMIGDNLERSWIIYGEALSGEVEVLKAYDGILFGEYYGDYSGYVASFAGDVDGDGYIDAITGASANDDTAADSGSAYLFYGPLTGIKYGYAADARFRGSGSGDMAGTDVHGGEDVTGDGLSDLLVGAPVGNGSGTAYLISAEGATGGY